MPLEMRLPVLLDCAEFAKLCDEAKAAIHNGDATTAEQKVAQAQHMIAKWRGSPDDYGCLWQQPLCAFCDHPSHEPDPCEEAADE